MTNSNASRVTVKQLDASTFEVVVSGHTPTTHLVSVQAAYASRLIGDPTALAKLVARSFDFLLEREANTSIMRRFDLSLIASYFPEYERVIKNLLK